MGFATKGISKLSELTIDTNLDLQDTYKVVNAIAPTLSDDGARKNEVDTLLPDTIANVLTDHVASQHYFGDRLVKIAETEVTGGAVTTITFTGLDINTHKKYVVDIAIKNAVDAMPNINLYINGDQTATNYYSQIFAVWDGSILYTRSNNARIMRIGNLEEGIGIINMMLTPSGYAFAICPATPRNAPNAQYEVNEVAKIATVANITQIDLVSSVANAFDNGTTVRIWGMK